MPPSDESALIGYLLQVHVCEAIPDNLHELLGFCDYCGIIRITVRLHHQMM